MSLLLSRSILAEWELYQARNALARAMYFHEQEYPRPAKRSFHAAHDRIDRERADAEDRIYRRNERRRLSLQGW